MNGRTVARYGATPDTDNVVPVTVPAGMVPPAHPGWGRVHGHQPRAAVSGTRPAPEGTPPITSPPWSAHRA